MTTQPDLLPTEPSEAPALITARKRLAIAQQRLDEIEADGTDDLGVATQVADSELRMAATDVRRLEAAEIARRKTQ